MRRETTLAAGIAAVVAVSVLAAALVPGVVAEREPDDLRPSRLDVAGVTISADRVTGETATLVVNTSLAHAGGPAENVSVVVRAVGLESGMLESETERDLGTVRGDREVTVSQPIVVARSGGYRVETVVYEDGRRVREGAREVRGVGTLQPAYAETTVEFHRFGAGASELPPIQYTVADVAGNRTTLELSTFLTNRGDDPSERLRLVFVVRQSDSNIVAARESVEVGAIAPGRTATPSTAVTVPDGYNYYLDAVLWKDGVIVASARSVANLDPTEEIRANVTRRTVGIEVSDFETDEDGRPGAAPTEDREAAGGGAGVPGFGPGVALAALALLAAVLLARRSNR